MKKALILSALASLVFAGQALGSHPTYEQMYEVKRLAYELHDAARHVHYEAERARHHLDREESYALRRLHRLEKEARHFHREVERHRRDPRHTARDFERLAHVFEEAVYSFDHAHALRHVRRDFHRVKRLFHDLEMYYTGGYGDGRYEEPHYRDDRGHYPRGRVQIRLPRIIVDWFPDW